MRQLPFGDPGSQPLGDLETAPFDEGIPVGRKKFVQHRTSLGSSLPPFCTVPHIDRAMRSRRAA
jgi:hypothetical protein